MKPYFERDGIVIYHGDCREILPGLESVDLVLTDPPYGIGKKWSRQFCAKNGDSRLWDGEAQWDDNAPAGDVINAVVNAGRYCVVWGGNYMGLPPSRGWLVWDKVQVSTAGSDCELAWTNIDKPVRAFRMSRIDAYYNRAIFRKEHPTEKPIQLMRWCIDYAPRGTSTVLDPFMGCGASLIAARDARASAIGIEIEERYCEIAAKRLDQMVLPLEVTA